MRALKLALIALGLYAGFGDFQPEAGTHGWLPFKEAQAVVGRPVTPVSVAGVARRTARRIIILSNPRIYVPSLPPSCTVVVVEGTTLHFCDNTYYQQEGSQYVVVKVE